MGRNNFTYGTLDAYFAHAKKKLISYRRPPIRAVFISFFLLFFIGFFCFVDQLNHFWTTQMSWDRQSVLISMENVNSKVIQIKSSSGFIGRWERGSDPSDTMLRLKDHLQGVIATNHFLSGVIKKSDLSPTTVLVRLAPKVHYGDFSPLLTALQSAGVDKYGFL